MEEKTKLKEEIDAQAQNSQRGQNTQAELQTALMQVKSANTRLSQQLASEEKHKKDLQKGSFELQAKLTTVQEEHVAMVLQLQLERDVHQKELKSISCTLQLCQQERDEIQEQVHKLEVTSFINLLCWYQWGKTFRTGSRTKDREVSSSLYFFMSFDISNAEGHKVCFATKSRSTACLFLGVLLLISDSAWADIKHLAIKHLAYFWLGLAQSKLSFRVIFLIGLGAVLWV